ncbi:MAG: UDP binding domain-containing protein, partial [bacterium]
SPAHEIVEELRDRHADLAYCDPYVESFTVNGRSVAPLPQSELLSNDFDLGVILTDHSTFDWETVGDAFPTLVDTRNAFPPELKDGGPSVEVL